MKYLLWVCFLLCSTAFAQDASPNVAGEAWKKRVLGMNLLNPPARLIHPPEPVLATGIAPKICSVPLLMVAPPADMNDRMHIVIPPATSSRRDFAALPAPPCQPRQ